MPKEQALHIRVRLHINPGEDAPFPPYLPLHLFDDCEYDCRTPEDWLLQAVEGRVRKPVPALALLPVTDYEMESKNLVYEWQRIGVLDYEPTRDLYFVQKANAENRIVDKQYHPVIDGGFDENGNRLELPVQYWIPRIRLMFLAEDPKKFADRVAAAYFMRRRVESELRYNLYIDCMPTDGIDPPSASALKRMSELARAVKSLAKGGTE